MYQRCVTTPATVTRKSSEKPRVETSRNPQETGFEMFKDQNMEESHRRCEHCRMENGPHRRRRKPSRDDISRCQQETSFDLEQAELRIADKKLNYKPKHCPSCHCDSDLLNYPPLKNRDGYQDFKVLDAPHFVKRKSDCDTATFAYNRPTDSKKMQPCRHIHRKNEQCAYKDILRQWDLTNGIGDNDNYNYVFDEDVKFVRDANYQDDGEKSDLEVDVQNKCVCEYSSHKENPQRIIESCEEEAPSSFQEAENRKIRSRSKDKEDDTKVDLALLERDHDILKELNYEIRGYERFKSIGQTAERSPERKKKFKNCEKSPIKSMSRDETALKRNSKLPDVEQDCDIGELDESLVMKHLEQELRNISCCVSPVRSGGDRSRHRGSKRPQTIEDWSGSANEGSARVGAGDLDLCTNKNYIVDLIDRALSKELGGQPTGDKKELRFIGEPCARKTAKFQDKGTPTHVEELKNLRWEYIEHIQEDVHKLFELQKFLDTCVPASSGLHTRIADTSTSNKDHPPTSAINDLTSSVS